MIRATRIDSRILLALLVGLLMAWALPMAQAQPVAMAGPPVTFTQHNLVASDASITADNIDPNLVNPWGLVFNPTAVPWISDNGTGLSTIYNSAGNPQALVVTIPGAAGGTGTPSGIVFNGTSGFVVASPTSASLSGPARFIFVSEDGLINGWSPAANLTQAITAVDNSASGAVYKGVAMAQNMSDFFLYATDFHNNKIDVFDTTYSPAKAPGQFVDPSKPVAGFAPFGIAYLNGFLYVTYAKQGPGAHDDVAGPGLGYINVFNTDGVFVRRLASKGALNSPWGLALAPANFAGFPNMLLVGNFGDGAINAFNPQTGKFAGTLHGTDNKNLLIPGLWGLSFGNSQPGFDANKLFFTAGPADESKGIFGRLD